jgi:photosystem II stability/assembly factor-like uncharacterized protein
MKFPIVVLSAILSTGILSIAVHSAGGDVSVVFPPQQGWTAGPPIQRNGGRATINSVYYDGDDVWVVGADGLIARSFDDGRTFQEVSSGVTVGLNDIYVKKDRIWIVGDGGTILGSTDGGERFNKLSLQGRTQSSPSGKAKAQPDDLYSLQFVDDRHGFIVGDQGLILATSDSGGSWRDQKSGTNSQLFHLAFKGDRGWAVGTGGTLLHTDNSGATWYAQYSGVHEDLNRVYIVSDKTALVTGDKGILLRTDNWGTTWERIPIEYKDPLFGVSFVDKKTGWVVGYGGRIIRTYDGGRNWVDQQSGTKIDLFSVSFHKNRGYAIGRDGVILRYYERR